MSTADTVSLLAERLGAAGARSVLDIGCGSGGLCAALAAKGFAMTGIDPSAEAVALAGQRVAGAAFQAASAEALPFAPGAFDAAVFLNSLHHVPEPVMGTALAEALRVVGEGPVIVIEPLARGPFFEVMRPVEDETEIRAAALAAIGRLQAQGQVLVEECIDYDRDQPFADVDGFFRYLIQVDPARRDKVRQVRQAVGELFQRHAIAGTDGYRLPQPLRLQVLRRPG